MHDNQPTKFCCMHCRDMLFSPVKQAAPSHAPWSTSMAASMLSWLLLTACLMAPLWRISLVLHLVSSFPDCSDAAYTCMSAFLLTYCTRPALFENGIHCNISERCTVHSGHHRVQTFSSINAVCCVMASPLCSCSTMLLLNNASKCCIHALLSTAVHT